MTALDKLVMKTVAYTTLAILVLLCFYTGHMAQKISTKRMAIQAWGDHSMRDNTDSIPPGFKMP